MTKLKYYPDDSFSITTPIFFDLPSFSMINTTNNLDHYHNTILVGEWISGQISSISTLSSSKVFISASESAGLDDDLILSNPDILSGAKNCIL